MATSTNEHLDQLFSDLQQILAQNNEVLTFESIDKIFGEILTEISSEYQRAKMKETFISDLEVVLSACKQNLSHETIACTTNCYRLCRNMCAMCTDNQSVLNKSPLFIDLTHSLMSDCLCDNVLTEDKLVLLRCCVQFLGNYSSGNAVNQTQIWKKFHSVFRLLLQIDDTKLQEYLFLVIHICLAEPATVLAIPSETPTVLATPSVGEEWELLQTCLQIATDTDSQNGLLVIEDCWRIQNFCDRSYSNLSVQTRILVLEVLINLLKRVPADESYTVEDVVMETSCLPACDNIQYIAASFIMQAHLIPSLSSSATDHLQVLCTVKELECLCIATACHRLYGTLQDNDQLIKSIISLLQCIDVLGKQGDNVFTNVSKVSNQREVNTEHPVFGLKRDLIRLLGNMAYKHRHNQDLIRQLEGLPLILDQTNIDGKNPFITQWSVFAIHNLTEDNADNRQYIADLKLEGLANNQALMDEMGLSADTEGSRIVINKKR